MGLAPLPLERFCPRPASRAEQHAKIAVLERHFDTAVRVAEDSLGAQHTLAEALPNTSVARTSAVAELSVPPKRTALPIVTSALSVPEDLCLLEKRGDSYQLIAACVCAPSYWHLPDKIGQSLFELHAPVQGLNRALSERMHSFFERLPERRLFGRRNWLIHQSDALFQPAAEARTPMHSAAQAETLFVRSESQTLLRLSPTLVAFTIHVGCYPLIEIAAYPDAARSLRHALLDRNNDEREAASQSSYEQAVLALLEAVSPS